MILITLSFGKFGCKFLQYVSKVHDEISDTQCRSDVGFLSIFNTLKLSSSYLHSTSIVQVGVDLQSHPKGSFPCKY